MLVDQNEIFAHFSGHRSAGIRYGPGPRRSIDGFGDRRLALRVLGVPAGPLEALKELCGAVGVFQLPRHQTLSQEDRGLVSHLRRALRP
jgi:hypothetical protein